jgi:hypothetical protein
MQQIIDLSTEVFLFWSMLLTLLSLIALYTSFHSLHRARLIENTPTARIRSASQGYVELIGEADNLPGEPIIAPLSGSKCCWWKYRVERKKDKGWRNHNKATSQGLFLLRDFTGECIVDPDNATVTPSIRNIWYGPNPTPSAGPDNGAGTTYIHFARSGLQVSVNTTFDGDYRYTEELILPKDPLYAIGLFKSLGELDHKAMRDEMIKERLRQWKSDHAELLVRFDRNHDGHIDLDEWETARQEAQSEVTREQMQEDQQPLHTLSSTGSIRRPLLISTKEEFQLVRRYRYLSFFSLIAFFILGSATVWLFTVRLIH